MPGIENYPPKPVKRKWRTVTNLILHLHPVRVPARAIRFDHTFGLGGMAALLIVLQVVTGILLRFQYEPSVYQAYNSVIAMQEGLVFGSFARNIHYWTGQLLIVITVLHLARVIFTTGYFPPRHVNWLIGTGLLLGVILMNFTGYLLPWDQLSFWAVTVTSSMLDYIPVLGSTIKYQLLGGNHVGQATLMNFYNYHTGILPLLLVILMAYHFWKTRKAGGVVIPVNPSNPGREQTVPVIPNLVLKELTTALVLLAFVFTLSLLVDAPLKEQANPSVSPNPGKAPWYFLGIQELIVHLHPVFSVFVVPVLLTLGFILIPYSKKKAVNTGTWFSSPSAKKQLLKTLILTLVFIPLWIIADEYFLHFESWLPTLPSWISEGVLPFLMFILIAWLSGWLILNRYRIPYNELIMAGFVFTGMAYVIMMVTSLVFRGPGMQLVIPF